MAKILPECMVVHMGNVLSENMVVYESIAYLGDGLGAGGVLEVGFSQNSTNRAQTVEFSTVSRRIFDGRRKMCSNSKVCALFRRFVVCLCDLLRRFVVLLCGLLCACGEQHRNCYQCSHNTNLFLDPRE